MRYINKEYGFSFRPPYLDKFTEESPKGPPIKDIHFPGRCIIGAGYDYSAINGAMLVGKNGSLWGVKVSCFDGGRWLDNDDFIQNMGSACANTADGSFAHFASGSLTVKWAKHNEQGLAVTVGASKKLRVRVIFYPCYNWPGELSIEGTFVKGRSPYVAVIPGEVSLSPVSAVYKNRYQVILDTQPEREFFVAHSYDKPIDSATGACGEVMMDFIINKYQPSIYIYAAVGDEKILGVEYPRRDKIAKLIETSELRYGVNRTTGSGLGYVAENMLNSIMWSRIYYPYLKDMIFSPQRSLLDNHFNIDGTEENITAILGCFVGDGRMSEPQLGITVEDKMMAVLSVWHIYAHIKEKAGLVKLYGRLIKLYPPDARLVTAGAEKTEIAYKWTDSPLKERYNAALPVYSLDMSCMQLLAFDILERIAVRFDLPEARPYGLAKQELIKLINEVFWNEEKRLYMNRYVNGTWAINYGATSFYPLIAGAVDSVERLTELVNNLTDPKIFWGDYAVPTLSRDNRYYGKKSKPDGNGKSSPAYLDYRGSIVPHVNYIIYHGLVRYGLDEIAAEFAAKSVQLWKNNDTPNVENYSLYLPTGGPAKNKEYLSINGNMLAVIGMQELIDTEYFRSDTKNAIRFGTFAKGKHSLANVKLLGHAYGIEIDNTVTTLMIDNRTVFTAEGGRCSVRQFTDGRDGCMFKIDANEDLQITMNIPLNPAPGEKRVHINFAVPAGKSKVVIEGDTPNIQLINA